VILLRSLKGRSFAGVGGLPNPGLGICRLSDKLKTLRETVKTLGDAATELGMKNEDTKAALGAKDSCVVCFDSRSDCIVLPCKHLCLCGPCGQRLTALTRNSYFRLPVVCPVCHGSGSSFTQVFRP
jgi:hypothetical protein